MGMWMFPHGGYYGFKGELRGTDLLGNRQTIRERFGIVVPGTRLFDLNEAFEEPEFVTKARKCFGDEARRWKDKIREQFVKWGASEIEEGLLSQMNVREATEFTDTFGKLTPKDKLAAIEFVKERAKMGSTGPVEVIIGARTAAASETLKVDETHDTPAVSKPDKK